MTALSNQYCLPDGITPEIFLRDYWQKKPLIIRNGLPEIVGQFEPDDIIELAQGEEVTARLVKTFSDDNWKVFFSPLSEEDFADVPEKWSVLVQNLEQWSTELGQLWNKFGFIPQWQRDDIWCPMHLKAVPLVNIMTNMMCSWCKAMVIDVGS